MRIEIDEIVHSLRLKPLGDKGFQVVYAGKAHETLFCGQAGSAISLTAATGVETIHLAFSETRDPLIGEAQWRGRRYVLRDLTLSAALSASTTASDGAVKAPMAGRVVAMLVKPGDSVGKGTPLLLLEAMKMEHSVTAKSAGTVSELLVTTGAQVTLGQVLARIAP